MSLINCKIKLKLKRTNHCVLSAAGADNAGGNSNNITFTITDTKLHVPVVILSAKHIQKLSKLLNERFEKSMYWNEYKTKNTIKIQQTSTDVFSNQALQELSDCLF